MLIAIAVVVGALIGVASWSITSSADDSGAYYRATSTLLFHPPPNNSTWAFQNLNELALRATAGEAPTRVAEKSGTSAADLTDRIITRSDETTNTIQISVVGQGARATEELSNALADELQSTITAEEQARFVAERDETIARLESLAGELAQLDSQLVTAATDRDLLTTRRQGILNQYWFTYEQFQQFTAQGNPSARVSPFESATAVPVSGNEYDSALDLVARGENNLRVDADSQPSALVTDSTWRDGALARGLIGGFLGLLIGLGLAFGADLLRPRVRTRDDTESAFAAPVLAEIPRLGTNEQRSGAVVAITSPRSRSAEAYRAVRSQILAHARGGSGSASGASGPASAAERTRPEHGLVVMVASASPGEGKSTTAANLAAVFAEAGASVLAMDCDLRRPRLGALLGASAGPQQIGETDIDGVQCITGVSDDPTMPPPRAVALQRDLVEKARRRFDVVVLDTAPLLMTNDATELVPVVDVVAVVARAGMTAVHDAERARHLLEHFGASVVGVVLLDPYLSSKDRYYDSAVPKATHVEGAGAGSFEESSEQVERGDDLEVSAHGAELSR